MRVDLILGPAGPLRDEYEKLLENPRTLLKNLAAWFAARGHKVCLTSIRRHRNRHLRTYDEMGEHWVVMTDPEGNEFCVS